MNVNTKEKYDTETKKTQITLILFLTHFVKIIQIRSFFWSVFSHIRTEYGEIRIISPHSARMPENTDQKKLRMWTLSTQRKAGLIFSVSKDPSK